MEDSVKEENNISTFGMTSNKLKIIALISMIIDHIGFYFYLNISEGAYSICRIIGRLAMPIFAFLILQGFMHTKSKAKYFTRLILLAVVTQILLKVAYHINVKYFEFYNTDISSLMNIVFSFALSVLMLMIIEYKVKLNKKIDKIILYSLKALLIIAIFSVYFIIDIDYSFYVPLEIVSMYIITKICEKYNKDKLCPVVCSIILVILSVAGQGLMGIWTLFVIWVISLYNGKLGKKSKVLKYSFYIIYPVHHVLLYIAAMLLSGQ